MAIYVRSQHVNVEKKFMDVLTQAYAYAIKSVDEKAAEVLSEKLHTSGKPTVAV
jgi:ABC-type transporter MlaC component